MKEKCSINYKDWFLDNDTLQVAIDKISEKLEDLNFGIAKKFKYNGNSYYALYPESTLATISVTKEYQEYFIFLFIMSIEKRQYLQTY